MSKASEWAKRMKDVEGAKRDVERARPVTWCLHLNSTERIDFSVGSDGTPEISVMTKSYFPSAPDLVKAAKWIIDTFADRESTNDHPR